MAAGDTLLIFTPHANAPPATNYATLDTRNSHWVLDFDDTTQEGAVFFGVMPRNYAGGGVTVYVHHAATTATTGTIGWVIAFERIGDRQQDLDADGFAAENTITAVTVSGTSGQVDIVNTTFTDGADMDSVAVGEGFRLRVRRNVASDTVSGDAELLAVEIQETA